MTVSGDPRPRVVPHGSRTTTALARIRGPTRHEANGRTRRGRRTRRAALKPENEATEKAVFRRAPPPSRDPQAAAAGLADDARSAGPPGGRQLAEDTTRPASIGRVSRLLGAPGSSSPAARLRISTVTGWRGKGACSLRPGFADDPEAARFGADHAHLSRSATRTPGDSSPGSTARTTAPTTSSRSTASPTARSSTSPAQTGGWGVRFRDNPPPRSRSSAHAWDHWLVFQDLGISRPHCTHSHLGDRTLHSDLTNVRDAEGPDSGVLHSPSRRCGGMRSGREIGERSLRHLCLPV